MVSRWQRKEAEDTQHKLLRALTTPMLVGNPPTQAEILLHSQERAAGGMGRHVNTDKTESMCFNQIGNISILKGGPLKLVDKFTNLRNSVSTPESNINTQLAKAWTAIDRLSVRPDR